MPTTATQAMLAPIVRMLRVDDILGSDADVKEMVRFRFNSGSSSGPEIAAEILRSPFTCISFGSSLLVWVRPRLRASARVQVQFWPACHLKASSPSINPPQVNRMPKPRSRTMESQAEWPQVLPDTVRWWL